MSHTRDDERMSEALKWKKHNGVSITFYHASEHLLDTRVALIGYVFSDSGIDFDVWRPPVIGLALKRANL